MSEWSQMSLGDVCAEGGGFIKTGPFGSQLHQSDYTEDPDGIPVVMPKDMRDGRIDVSSIARIDTETARRLSGHLLSENDIVLSRRGDVGRSAWVSGDDLPAFCGTGSMRVHPGRPVSVRPDYLRYFFRSRLASSYLEGHAVGATMPNLNAKIVENLPVPVLPRSLQAAVAFVLDAFDDLIENNRRRVAVLEEMARAIYREWFVHFRYPGWIGTVPLNSPGMPTPEGWEIKRIAELSHVVRGITPKYAANGAWVVLNQKCIRDERVSLGPSRRQERQVPETKRVQHGDVLINSTGVGRLGRVALYRGQTPHLTVDSHVTIVRPADSLTNPWFGLALISKQSEFERLATGSTGQTELSRSDVGSVTTLLPPAEVLRPFARAAWPLLYEADSLLAWNATVAQLRDLLLPRFVTGQIDVSSLNLGALIEETVA